MIVRRASKSHEEGDARNVNESLDDEAYGNLYARTIGVFDHIERNIPAKGRLAYLRQDGLTTIRRILTATLRLRFSRSGSVSTLNVNDSF